MSISVCIATYRRAERLALLLEDLRQQERLPDEVIVVDNDAVGSARSVVRAAARQRRPSGLNTPCNRPGISRVRAT